MSLFVHPYVVRNLYMNLWRLCTMEVMVANVLKNILKETYRFGMTCVYK